MGERGVPRLPRYVALIAVLAIHFAVVTVLFLASRGRVDLTPSNNFTTTLVAALPSARSVIPAPELHTAPLASVTSFVPPSSSITIESVDSPSEPIDWRAEAHSAAATITDSKPAPTPAEDRRKTASSQGPRPWFPAAKHHAGEDSRSITGEKIVWINDKCFVRTSAPLPGVPDMIARSMLSGTVCPRGGRAARGDLFEALPAYKKLHPDAGTGEAK